MIFFLCFFPIVQTFLILVVCAEAASGLSIVYNSLPKLKHTCIILSSFSFVLMLGIIIYGNPSFALFLIILVLFFLSFFLYEAVFFVFSNFAIIQLNAHLALIENRGINPLTTPSYKKLIIIKRMRNFCAVALSFVSITMVIFFSEAFSYWVSRLLQVICLAFLSALLCSEFRLRYSMAANYGESEEPYIVTDNSSNGQDNLKSFSAGMTLPPMPQNQTKTIKIIPAIN